MGENSYLSPKFANKGFHEWLKGITNDLHTHWRSATVNETHKRIARTLFGREDQARVFGHMCSGATAMPLEAVVKLARLVREALSYGRPWGDAFFRKWFMVRKGLDLSPSDFEPYAEMVWGSSADWPVTSNLKLTLAQSTLVGRDDELEKLERILVKSGALFISGPGGIGKTAVADRLTTLCLDYSRRHKSGKERLHFRYIVRVTAKTDEIDDDPVAPLRHIPETLQVTTLEAMLQRIVEGFQNPARLSGSLEGRVQATLAIIDRHTRRVGDMPDRVLLVIDNAETLDSQAARVLGDFISNLDRQAVSLIYTTRTPSNAAGVQSLDPLNNGASTELVQSVFKASMAREPAAGMLAEILSLGGGNPAALKFVANARMRGQPLHVVNERLTSPNSDVARYLFGAWADAARQNEDTFRWICAVALFSSGCESSVAGKIAGLDNSGLGVADAAEFDAQRWPGILFWERATNLVKMERLPREYLLQYLNRPHSQAIRDDLMNRLVDWTIEFCAQHGGAEWSEWQDRYKPLQREWLTIDKASAWLCTKNDWQRLGRIWGVTGSAGCEVYAHIYGAWRERIQYLGFVGDAIWKLVLEGDPSADRGACARAYRKLGYTYWLQGDDARAMECYQRVRTLLDRLPAYEASRLECQVGAYHAWARSPDFRASLEAARTHARYVEDEKGRDRCIAESHFWLGVGLIRRGATPSSEDLEAARQEIESCIAISTRIGWERQLLYAQHWLARILIERGEYPAADAIIEAGLFRSRDHYSDKRLEAGFRLEKGRLGFRSGDDVMGKAEFGKAVQLYGELGMRDCAGEARDELNGFLRS